jgi:hypothetical protein
VRADKSIASSNQYFFLFHSSNPTIPKLEKQPTGCFSWVDSRLRSKGEAVHNIYPFSN